MISSTLFRFTIELSDIDRGVYEQINLQVPQHPSEDEERLIIRVLARSLSHEEGLEFGRGLSTKEDAALWKLDAQGQAQRWIEVGAPSAERLHKASKKSDWVEIYTSKSQTALRKEWSRKEIFRAEHIRVHFVEPQLLSELSKALDRRVKWYISRQDNELSISDEGGRNWSGSLRTVSLLTFLNSSVSEGNVG